MASKKTAGELKPKNRPKRRKSEHATIIRIRNDTADALVRVAWETGKAKSAFLAEAVTQAIVRREVFIAEGETEFERFNRRYPKGVPGGVAPKSPLHDLLEVPEDSDG
jgi:predicted DNA-binding protein